CSTNVHSRCVEMPLPFHHPGSPAIPVESLPINKRTEEDARRRCHHFLRNYKSLKQRVGATLQLQLQQHHDCNDSCSLGRSRSFR
ncbi:unnamed protein product, partial [Pylaiella littoralis]